MRFATLRDGGIAAMTMLVSPISATADLDCANVSVDGYKFDLSSLKGPHSVSTWRPSPPKTINTTYTIDICSELKMKGDVPESRRCADGTRVCAIKHLWDPEGEDKEELMGVVSIAGKLSGHGGGDLEFTATLLNTNNSDTDSQMKGVQLTLHGGRYPLTDKGIVQKAIIDFVCKPKMDGSEGEWDSEDKYEKTRKREDESNDKNNGQEEQFTKGENTALVFHSYGFEDNDEKTQTLRMTWYSKAGCGTKDNKGSDDKNDDNKGGDDKLKESQSWGFFTWVVILAFLAIASYLIFGSWLNYNRYGARGWDLVPHGDAIRDVPFLLKDWGRRALNTVQGGGSRGGYSAV